MFGNHFAAPVDTVIQVGSLGQIALRQPPVSAHVFANGPLLVGGLPSLAAGLQERESDQALAEAFEGGASTLCQIVSGMGGVGKTQAATAYARRRWDEGDIDLLIWVAASDREAIISSFAAAAAQVCGVDPADAERAVGMFLSWLDRPDAPRWLIVLDDVADPADLEGLWPPSAPSGRTIVTTRRRDAAFDGDRRRRIDLGVFTEAQADAYLRRRLEGHAPALDGAEHLALTLGYLPLALAQAAAYIRDQPGSTCAAYAAMVEDQAVKLRELRPERLPDGYPVEVATCWSISVALADDEAPEGVASHMMSLASLLSPDGIPVDVLTGETVWKGLAVWVALNDRTKPKGRLRRLLRRGNRSVAIEDQRPLVSPHEALGVLARLHRLNLVQFDGETVRVHAIVQRAIRDGLSPGQRTVYAITGARGLHDVWPEVPRDPLLAASLRANTAQLRRHQPEALFKRGADRVLFSAGKSLEAAGRFAEAIAYFQELYADCERRFGSDHVSTMAARQHIAFSQGSMGAIDGPLAELEDMLPTLVQQHGDGHPLALSVRNNIAFRRGRAGDAEGALAEMEALLEPTVSVFGRDSAEALFARNNIAYWRGEAEDFEGALMEFEALVLDHLRVLGPDHPQTLAVRNNLAVCRGEAGDPARAAAELEAVLTDRVRVLGPDHPSTLLTRNNLAAWRGSTENLHGSLAELEALHDDLVRVLGPDHPHTFVMRGNIAVFHMENGNAQEAITQFAMLLADQSRVLGADHPDTQALSEALDLMREDPEEIVKLLREADG